MPTCSTLTHQVSGAGTGEQIQQCPILTFCTPYVEWLLACVYFPGAVSFPFRGTIFLMSIFFFQVGKYTNIRMWRDKMNLARPWIPLAMGWHRALLSEDPNLILPSQQATHKFGKTQSQPRRMGAQLKQRLGDSPGLDHLPSCVDWGEFLGLSFTIWQRDGTHYQPERVGVRMRWDNDQHSGASQTSLMMRITQMLVHGRLPRSLLWNCRFGGIRLGPMVWFYQCIDWLIGSLIHS